MTSPCRPECATEKALPKPAGPDLGGATGQQPHFDAPPPAIHDRESIGVKWSVHDDNDDQMVYSVYYRGDADSRWLLLKDNLTEKFYSFDASLLPDGIYRIKVVVSDAPSHSPGQALSAEKESPPFEVDTTEPRIENLAAAVEGDQIHLTFRALDSFSTIKRAEYSVDAGEWQFVDKPTNYRIRGPKVTTSASPCQQPALRRPAARNGAAGQIEHVVVVRVFDRYENMISAKAVIRAK